METTLENLHFSCEVTPTLKECQVIQKVYGFGHTSTGESCCVVFTDWKMHIDIDLTQSIPHATEQEICEKLFDGIETANDTINEKKAKKKRYHIIEYITVFHKRSIAGYNTRHIFSRIFMRNFKDCGKLRKVLGALGFVVFEAHLKSDIVFLNDYGMRTMTLLKFEGVESSSKESTCTHEIVVSCKDLKREMFTTQTQDMKNNNLKIYWGSDEYTNHVQGGLKTPSFHAKDDENVKLWLCKMKEKVERGTDEVSVNINTINLFVEKYNANHKRLVKESHFLNYKVLPKFDKDDEIEYRNKLETQSMSSEDEVDKLEKEEVVIKEETTEIRKHDETNGIGSDVHNEEIEITQIDIQNNENAVTFNQERNVDVMFNQERCEEESEHNVVSEIVDKFENSLGIEEEKSSIVFNQQISSEEEQEFSIPCVRKKESQPSMLQLVDCDSVAVSQEHSSPSVLNDSHIFGTQRLLFTKSQNFENVNFQNKTENFVAMSNKNDVAIKNNEIVTCNAPPTFEEVINDFKTNNVKVTHEGLTVSSTIKKRGEMKVYKYLKPPPSLSEIIRNETKYEPLYYANHPYELELFYSQTITNLDIPYKSSHFNVLFFKLLFRRIDGFIGDNPTPNHDKIEGAMLYRSSKSENCFIFVHTSQDTINEFHRNCHDIHTKDCVVDSELSVIETILTEINTDSDIIVSEDISFSMDFISIRWKMSTTKPQETISRLIGSLGSEGRVLLSFWYIYKKCGNYSMFDIQYIAHKELHVFLPQVSHTQFSPLANVVTNFLLFHCSIYLVAKFGYFERLKEFATFHSCPLEEEIERGTQYRVECCLKRVSEDFELFSPTPEDLEGSRPTTCVPLVMEPVCGFHENPVVVLDFLSMYPTTMIAYNMCYSTCLGYLDDFDTHRHIGPFWSDFARTTLSGLENNIHVAANGVIFVDAILQKGVLPLMLEEILSTRQHVKDELKTCERGSDRNKQINTQQLALKLLCNVVYGYTGAGFTGRMPCSAIADATIETARQTLERAIEYVRSVYHFNVIYSDTDSLFVEMPHTTLHDAFVLGKEIAANVTKSLPRPMELQLEKVYFPSVLVTKKRYFGMNYRSEESKPFLEIKGLEAVRRDSCRATKHIMMGCIKYLMGKDVDALQLYLQKNWKLIEKGEYNLLDFVISRPIHYNVWSTRGMTVGAQVALKEKSNDETFHCQDWQRISYVIVKSNSKKICEKSISPQFAAKNRLEVDVDYYIEKHINSSIGRILQTCGIDINSWRTKHWVNYSETNSTSKARLEDFFGLFVLFEIIFKTIR
ncbi:DNA polymerase zeta catalytic subunit, putative [Entamoeba invadens IP1]|uniref:DNA polymerase n=1 Tax=Entamoeba invadens IP1 TaxID=370355 RepID=A0A0A1U3R7_ENTIV|nr:DNA polymerase zeta catalytic subunit, putative [Entamoeba invadens IP1]ELP87368.1 DNA polymerase zeta catalytic subunit, putative [Entamoeba invadens IP1]|eukprot:XP_004254139.1 DNA polymerase zeta catalytic subunit, putative [Entamoeba invadens IP1]